jgi:hypothetical protein
MTRDDRDNVRESGIPKPLECSHCKKIETVKHMLFECIDSNLFWANVF